MSRLPGKRKGSPRALDRSHGRVSRQRFAFRQFLRGFLEALADEFRGFLRVFGAPDGLEILADENDRFVVLIGQRELVADKVSRQVLSGGRVIAPFKAITAIEVAYIRKNDDYKVWEVSLRILRDRRVSIARLGDDTDASILAARLSTATGAKVVAV